MTHTPIAERDRGEIGGSQQIYRFDNGYGASVVRGKFTYGGDKGLFELGVIKFDGDKWRLNYETPITSDVEGSLTPDEVMTLLDRIAALPAPSKPDPDPECPKDH